MLSVRPEIIFCRDTRRKLKASFYHQDKGSLTTANVHTSSVGKLKSWKEIPGPNTLPLIGTLHHFLPGGVFYNYDGIELARKLYDTYGPIVRVERVIGRPPKIFLYDAESAAKILRAENWSPIRPGLETLTYYRKNIRKHRKDGMPTGLNTDNGDEWRDLRTAANPIMLQPKNVIRYTAALDEVAKDTVTRIKSQRDESNRLKTKFENEVCLWSLESSGVVAIGCRMGCLDPNIKEDSLAKKLIECVHEEFRLIGKLDFGPSLWKYFSTRKLRKAMATYELQDTITEQFVNQTIRGFKSKNDLIEGKSILEKLLEIKEEYALNMVSDLMFAGVEASANTLAAVLYLLAVNPEKQNKLREEIRSNNETKPYLKACVKESNRLMPISLGTRRVTTKEYNILGYKIPANMYITVGNHLMSQMEEHYPRPLEYIPERWLVDEGDPLYYKQAHSYAYAPFGFGVRNCIALRIAKLMLELTVTRMVDEFQMEWTGAGAPATKETFINFIKGPFHFVFKDAPK